MKRKSRKLPEVSSGSMADIAFLLLIFFLVTTTIANDKGIPLLLPAPPDPNQPELDLKIPERNIFKIRTNSRDQLLVEDEPFTSEYAELTLMVRRFILNFGSPSSEGVEVYNGLPASLKAEINRYGRDPKSSDDPTGTNAIVSIKCNRGTTYELYINVLDAVNSAYNQVYAARAGITSQDWLTLNIRNKDEKALYARGRKGISRAISIAEPD